MDNKRTFESFASELLDSLNERSINKIQKDWNNVTAIMKDTVEKWKAAKGSEKDDLKDELITLTITKNKLEAELEDAVGLKDVGAELVSEGTMSDIHQLAGEVKDLAQFTKEFFKRFGDKIKKTADSVEWVASLYKDMTNESVVNEAVARDTKIYCIATPAPRAMLYEELEELFGDDYRHYITEFKDDEGYESILVFNLTKRDIKMIQENIADVLIWEYSIKKGKEIMESVVTEANQLKKGDTVKFKDGRSIHIIGPKGDGYDYKDGREKGHHPKGWFDMMISSGKAIVESVVTEATGFKIGDKVKITKFIQDAEHDETGHLYNFNRGVKVEITDIDGKHSYQFKYLDKLPNERYWALQKEFKANVIKESTITEGKKVTLKRRYTENHPAVTVSKNAKVRNRVLEFIKDGRITQEAFEKFVADLSNNSKRWTKNNSRYFTISEEGVSLSKMGKKLLAGITVNEGKVSEDEIDTIYIEGTFKDGGEFYEDQETTDVEWVKKNYRKITKDLKSSEIFIRMNNGDEISYAEYKKQVNEATTSNPGVWVPGEFDKELNKLPNSKITLELVSKLAKKYKIDLEDAIKYVEYGWAMDLNENNTMKTKFIYESFGDFVNSLNESTETLNEAFASQKLASLLTGGAHMDKDLPKAFYNMSKLKLDQIQDVDIIEMDPATAKKEKRANAIYMYFTTNEKENPYAGKSAWRDERQIPANTLLAITNGQNEWMATEWQRSYSRDKNATRTLKVGKREDAAGFKKSGRGEYNSGISSMKQVSELADRAYVLDLDILKARYSATTQRDERAAAKKGAIAFKNDKDFKAENLARYNEIIANKASKLPIDKIVKDAIDKMSEQIKDALVKGEKGRYGDIIVGTSDKGREAKLRDAANHMQNILDDYQRYVNYVKQAEEEEKAGYGSSYYEREVKNYAKNVTDKVKQIEGFSYAW